MSDPKSIPMSYAVWPTSWGPMGAVAGPRGLTRVVLPHYPRKDLLALLAWEHPGAILDQGPLEPFVRASTDYFAARAADFSAVLVDLPAEDTFFGKVYRACQTVTLGRQISYRELAIEIGAPDAARAVATALGKNPTPLVVPCHRIIYSSGGLGGFSAEGGLALKQRMLTLEAGMKA